MMMLIARPTFSRLQVNKIEETFWGQFNFMTKTETMQNIAFCILSLFNLIL